MRSYGSRTALLQVRSKIFPRPGTLEFLLQKGLRWAYYPARMSRGGSSESIGSDRVP